MSEIPSFDEYQGLALRTASPESLVDGNTMLNAAALGLNGEAGEIADHVKKIMFHGNRQGDWRHSLVLRDGSARYRRRTWRNRAHERREAAQEIP